MRNGPEKTHSKRQARRATEPGAGRAPGAGHEDVPCWSETERQAMTRRISATIRAWRPALRADTPARVRALAILVQAGVEFESLCRREADAMTPPEVPGRAEPNRPSPELARLLKTLRRDPSRVGRQLRKRPDGCRWMIAGWRRLGERLLAGSDWNRDERDLAFDLLGTPVPFRDDRPGEQVARKNIGLICPLPTEAPAPPLERGQLLALVRQQIEQLEARAGDLNEPTPPVHLTSARLSLARRYRQLADRALDRMQQAMQALGI